jgi:hypothetical protein
VNGAPSTSSRGRRTNNGPEYGTDAPDAFPDFGSPSSSMISRSAGQVRVNGAVRVKTFPKMGSSRRDDDDEHGLAPDDLPSADELSTVAALPPSRLMTTQVPRKGDLIFPGTSHTVTIISIVPSPSPIIGKCL